MFVTIRQFNKPLAMFATRARTRLTARDLERAQQLAKTIAPAMQSGYFDIVLTHRPDDDRYDVDSTIEVN